LTGPKVGENFEVSIFKHSFIKYIIL